LSISVQFRLQTYLHVQIPVATNEQPGYLEHLARRGRSAENSLAWSVSDKSSRGAALIELLCDGTTSKVLIAASVSHSPTHPLAHSLTHSLTPSLTHSLTHSLTLSLTHSLPHPPTHSLAHPPTHSITHSLTLVAASVSPTLYIL